MKRKKNKPNPLDLWTPTTAMFIEKGAKSDMSHFVWLQRPNKILNFKADAETIRAINDHAQRMYRVSLGQQVTSSDAIRSLIRAGAECLASQESNDDK
jgi:hypothetical protein